METTDLTLQVLLEIRDEARATNARLDQTNARLERTEVHLTARLDKHERILLRVAEELGNIHGKLERMDDVLERMDGALERIDGTLERIDGRVVRLEGGQELTNERLERPEIGQQLTNDRLRTLVGLTGAVIDRQSQDGAAIEDLRRRVGLLECKLG
jgi:predicted  nucleic acid-binding Zn-ribbon protein